MAAVLKTAMGSNPSWVRIPRPPLCDVSGHPGRPDPRIVGSGVCHLPVGPGGRPVGWWSRVGSMVSSRGSSPVAAWTTRTCRSWTRSRSRTWVRAWVRPMPGSTQRSRECWRVSRVRTARGRPRMVRSASHAWLYPRSGSRCGIFSRRDWSRPATGAWSGSTTSPQWRSGGCSGGARGVRGDRGRRGHRLVRTGGSGGQAAGGAGTTGRRRRRLRRRARS